MAVAEVLSLQVLLMVHSARESNIQEPSRFLQSRQTAAQEMAPVGNREEWPNREYLSLSF